MGLLLAGWLLLLAAAPAGAQTGVDYDTDDNRLIEIGSPAQLNAIRYDLDGDGTVDSPGDQTGYDAGFANAAATQCPTSCQGYELDANLNLTAAFPNWTSIGAYTGVFDGQGHTISGLAVTSATLTGLFSTLEAGGVIRNVGLLNPLVISSGASENAGALAGYVAAGATIDASYVAGGSVAISGASARAGGLVGQNNGRIRASYSTAAVGVAGNPNGLRIGGLVGLTIDGQLIASYAAGPVTPIGTGSGVQAGGLVGRSQGAAASATNSYCDTTATMLDDCIGANEDNSAAAAPGYATAYFQRPTGYEDLFAHWNLDLDGDDSIDWLWDFGGASDYPTLKPPAQRRAPARRDYDANNNNLIDINNLAQLSALRWDSNGDGDPDAAENAGAYTSAFPGRAEDEDGRMGCPDACAGYELRRNLTFPAAAAPYYTWTPIGGSYSAIFDGNGRSLTGLKAEGLMNVGLFSALGSQAVVQRVGLINPEVSATTRLSFFRTYAGALAGQNSGRIHTSYVRGGSVTVSSAGPGDSIQPAAGGLVGLNQGTIRTAWATARVSNGGAASDATLGGLVGRSESGAIVAAYAAGPVSGRSAGPLALGGLVGYSRNSAITASYARGAVSGRTSSADPGDLDLGGLVGHSWGGGEAITDGYCDTEASKQADCIGDRDAGSGSAAAAPGYDTAGLRTPTGYESLYEDWNVDVGSVRSLIALLSFSGPRGTPLLSAEFDGDGRPDRPWDFGASRDYPLLKADFNGDGKATWSEFGRQYRYIEITPYNPASAHPESYANPRYEMSAACEVRTTGTGDAAVTTATLTFDLGGYTRPVVLALSLWDGTHYRSLQSQGLAMPQLQRSGQTATVQVVTDPAQTRFRIDGQYGLNLVLGYADCRTDDPEE